MASLPGSAKGTIWRCAGCGEGGFLFNAQELATAVQKRIPVVIVLVNDNAYGNVRRIQRDQFGNRLIASDPHNPDFQKFVDSFGALAMKASSLRSYGGRCGRRSRPMSPR